MLNEKEILQLKNCFGLISKEEAICINRNLCVGFNDLHNIIKKIIKEYEQPKPLPEMILERLGVKVNEWFSVKNEKDMMVGDFCFDNSFMIKNQYGDYANFDLLRDLIVGVVEIIKLPPQPLLTNDEREWLKGFNGLSHFEKNLDCCYFSFENKKGFYVNNEDMFFLFNGLEFDKKYTSKELGLC